MPSEPMIRLTESIRTNRRRTLVAAAASGCLALLLLSAQCWSQTPPKPPSEADYAAGLALMEQLKGSTESDAPIFQKIGAEQSTTELMAVVNRGQAQSATTADW